MANARFEEVTKYFGEVEALSSLSLMVEDGEFLVLVGPSGCGKTTALRCMAGLEEPDEGRVFIGDEDVTYIEPKDRDIAMVFQNYALYPHMDVYGNMAFGLKLRKTPKGEIERRVRDAAELLGISEKLKSKPRELSGGQRQRVAVGRAIVRNPKVFLFDEPLSNLDAKLRVQMRTELEQLHHTLKTTTIYVTHDQIEAMTLGDRIVIMKDGVVQQIGTPQEVFDRPSNLFVAGFIGTPQMNFFDAKLAERAGRYTVTIGDTDIELADSLCDLLAKAARVPEDITLGIRPEQVTIMGRQAHPACPYVQALSLLSASRKMPYPSRPSPSGMAQGRYS